MTSININELKETHNRPLLKKFIAMKVFMEARHAAENKSLFNVTAQFRNVLALLFPALALGADYGEDPERTSRTGRGVRGPAVYDVDRAVGGPPPFNPGEDRKDAASNGYRLFHINNMGYRTWERKFFNLGVDEESTIYTKRITTSMRYVPGYFFIATGGPYTIHGEIQKWDLLNESHLRRLFKEIKKETEYDNTLAYDLFCVASIGINMLLDLSINSGWFALILVPLALAVTAAIYTVVIPLSFTLYVLENLLVNPIKWAIDSLLIDKNEVFIEEVCQVGAGPG